jgi:hypothetical protein
MIQVPANRDIIGLSPPYTRQEMRPQDRRCYLAARAACRDRLQIIHQALWGAPWMRSAQFDIDDVVTDETLASAWLRQPVAQRLARVPCFIGLSGVGGLHGPGKNTVFGLNLST